MLGRLSGMLASALDQLNKAGVNRRGLGPCSSGALYSFEDRLAAIELQPLKTREVILADGRRERRLFGEARLSVEGLDETLTCPLVFGPKGSLYLLGATALEAFGVNVDPIARRLQPVAAVIGGFPASR